MPDVSHKSDIGDLGGDITPENTTYSGDVRFTSPGISPSKLGSILIDRYGQEWISWSPETIWKTITADFSTEIHPISKEKINAIKTLLMTDDFWEEWQVFEKVVKAFNNLIPSFDVLEGSSPAEMAWAVSQANLIRKMPFNEEVVAYIRSNADNLGWVWLPDELRFAKRIPVTDLEKKVAIGWNEVAKNLNFNVEEDEVGVQLARLNAARHMMRMRTGESEEVIMKSEKRW